MSTINFEPGDIVRLKPKGSPDMVVDKVATIGGKTRVWTTWFSGKKHEKATFSPESLVRVTDE